VLPNKPYSISALSLAIVLALSACHREVKPAPEFKRSEYNKIVISNAVEPSTLDPQKSSDMAGGGFLFNKKKKRDQKRGGSQAVVGVFLNQ